MKSDLQLHKDVIEELQWDPRVNESEIGVSVKSGVVTLSGTVETFAQKYAAERAVERVAGVRAVAEELRVRPTIELQQDDTEIAHAAVNALSWNIEVPADKITVKVERGQITLKGEVDWNYQRLAAEYAVRYLAGVKGLMNLIEVRPTVSPAEVKSQIEAALKRSAELDAKQITVDTVDGKVTLRGKVRSWTERVDAENAAWAAPGVREVDDRLVVTPALA
jgi:osmotically-inducible protein OsmY